MTRHHRHTPRLLAAVTSPAIAVNAPPTTVPETVDSDFVVILAALLCALICVLGLVAVSRCACLRRISAAITATQSSGAGNKGLKKKTIMSLPKKRYTEEDAAKLTDCAICLSEFSAGDEIRVLPQCGHGFHVSCIDTWLGSHSTCPSCRQILAVERCHKCGGLPPTSGAAAAAAAAGEGRSCDSSDFLP